MNRITLSGFILGFAGAILDFSSGYLIFVQSMVTTNTMGVSMTEYNSFAVVLGIGLFVLGGLLIITAIASVSSFGNMRMRIFGLMMTVYGVVMLLIGELMYSRIAPMMAGSFLSSAGMFAVGFLMILNGVLMVRNSAMM
ncbi:MAG: hypothetical protein ACYCPW_09290 [Nitrososphaerales archaeon]